MKFTLSAIIIISGGDCLPKVHFAGARLLADLSDVPQLGRSALSLQLLFGIPSRNFHKRSEVSGVDTKEGL